VNVDYQVGIVGAGFGGIIAALALQREGRQSFVMFERAAAAGGVWRDNVYPGCACDVRSNLYSLEGEPNPHWSTNYASQPEILAYINGLIAQHRLDRHIRYGVNVTSIRFLEHEGCWQVYQDGHPSCRTRSMILATGPHSRPTLAGLHGIDQFDGPSFHSSQWDPALDLTGARVAVVGTGASSIQIVPNIAPIVSKLLVFQRTAAWVIPRGDRQVSRMRQALFARIPAIQHLSRQGIYWATELIGMAFMGNRTLNGLLTRVALRKLAREVRDPEIRRKLTPRYKIGCKRILISDDYYPAFNRPNVELVTDRIREIAPRGLVTEDGVLHEVDRIVYATGFVVADTEGYLNVAGRDGRILTDEWDRNGAEAYLGINVSGFPNLAILLGPNSGLGHSSALHVMESQMRYVVQYLDTLDRLPGKAFLDVDPDVQRRYNVDVQQRLQRTVWASGCRSWYLDRFGRNTTVFPGVTCQYRAATRRFRSAAYAVVEPDLADVRSCVP
jgi:cation diffusion facilitator CzcD-associated flavoprotein CzcO